MTSDHPSHRLDFVNPALGLGLWLLLLCLPKGPRVPIGAIEQFFLFAPLVIVPLALILVSMMLRAEGKDVCGLYRIVRAVQPPAALMVVVSFFFPNGIVAGLFTIPWVIVASLLGCCGLFLIKKSIPLDSPTIALIAAHVYIPVGAAELLLSRWGVPVGFPEPIVLLTAVHFHFTGFALPMMAAATGYRLKTSPYKFPGMYRLIVAGIVSAMPLIAGGFLFSLHLKIFGILILGLSLVGLAIIFAYLAGVLRSPLPSLLFFVSAGSIPAAMSLVGVYAAGELLGKTWITIPQMARTHGIINALGFSFCGLLGWLTVFYREEK